MFKEELICKKLEENFSKKEIEDKILNKEKGYEFFLYSKDYKIRDLVINQFSQREIIENLEKVNKNRIIVVLLKSLREYDPILEILSRDKEWEVRMAVASNENTSIEILERLSRDRDIDVRYRVASNKNCSKEILERLSRDTGFDVRLEIAKNQNISTEILKILSKDESSYIRKLVASNIKTPKVILKRLSKDRNFEVIYAAVHNEKFLKN